MSASLTVWMLADDVRPLVEGHDLESRRQDGAGVDLRDAGLDRLDDLAAVGPAQHHDDAADRLAPAVLDRRPLADGLARPDLGHVAKRGPESRLRT